MHLSKSPCCGSTSVRVPATHILMFPRRKQYFHRISTEFEIVQVCELVIAAQDRAPPTHVDVEILGLSGDKVPGTVSDKSAVVRLALTRS